MMWRPLQILVVLAVALVLMLPASAQDPARFGPEVSKLVSKDKKIKERRNLIVFTGSSSVRMWPTIHRDFPGYNVINRGFGGSHMSDLLYYADDLILKHRPMQVFIYEGDNDLAHGKTPEQVITDTRKLIARLQGVQPEIKIVIIAAKPSVARWRLHKRYEELNLQFKVLASKVRNVEFADVWEPMLDPNGQLQQDLFLEDKLHMNDKGYAIWREVMLPLLAQP